MPKEKQVDLYQETEGDTRLLDLIRNAPELSPVSKRRYVANLKVLTRVSGHDLEWVLHNALESLDALYKYLSRRESEQSTVQETTQHSTTIHHSISARPAATVRSYCASVSALFKRLPPDYLNKIGTEEVRAWQKCNEDAMQLVRDKYDNWRASDRQRDNYVPWEQLIARRDKLGKNPETYAGRSHLLLSLLTYLPPMRTSDLGSLRVMECNRRVPRGKKAREALKTSNYVVLCKTKGTITVNEYKTARHYQRMEQQQQQQQQQQHQQDPRELIHTYSPQKPQREYDDTKAERSGDLPQELFKVLKTSLRIHPRQWVFVDRRGDPYQDASFNKMVSLELSSLFDGKALSVNLIRHAAAIWLDNHHRHDADLLRYFRY
jgi:hypothetical protein